MLENLVLFAQRLNLLKVNVELGRVVKFSHDTTGITCTLLENDGTELIITHYDGAILKTIKNLSYHIQQDVPIDSFISYVLNLSMMFGSDDIDDIYSTIIGGAYLNESIPLIKSILDSASIDYDILDDGFMLYGDCIVGSDNNFYLSLGGQKSIYPYDVNGLCMLVNSLMNFYPELNEVLPQTNIEVEQEVFEDDYTTTDEDFIEDESDDFGFVAESRRIISSKNKQSVERILASILSKITRYALAIKEYNEGIAYALDNGIMILELNDTELVITTRTQSKSKEKSFTLDTLININTLDKYIADELKTLTE